VAGIHDWIEQLGDADASQRAAAAERLCREGAAAAAAAVPLVQACADDDDQVREWAAAALEDLGPPPNDAIPQLVELAGSSHPLVAYWAVTLLGRSGQEAEAATAVLAACLDSDCDPSVAQRAAWALGKIGPAAAAAQGALEKAASAADPRLARLAREALDVIGP
jgi:HEAT repeat protein